MEKAQSAGSAGKHVTGTRRGKTYIEPMPNAGKHLAGAIAKRRKITGNQYQSKSAKSKETCHRYQVRENMQIMPSMSTSGNRTKGRKKSVRQVKLCDWIRYKTISFTEDLFVTKSRFLSDFCVFQQGVQFLY